MSKLQLNVWSAKTLKVFDKNGFSRDNTPPEQFLNTEPLHTRNGMIMRTKLKFAPVAALVAIVCGLLIGSATYAQTSDSVAASAPSSAPASDSHDQTVGVGTAFGGSDATPSDHGAKDADGKPSLTTKVLDAISKKSDGREAKQPDWKIEQDMAVMAARQGQYDQALPMLEKLHNEHPQDLGIATDYAAILGWAGRDQEAVNQYEGLPAGDRPDYLIDAIGHSYRNLHQPEKALDVYHLGLQTFPDNQSFLGGEIFSLLESGKTDEAVAHAQDANTKYPQPAEPLALAIKEAFHVNAVALARAGKYKEAIPALAALRKQYPDDFGIAADNVAVLSWAGRDADAVKEYRALVSTNAQGDVPDYVLDAAAHSYRNLHQPKQALALYEAALKKDPNNVTYAVGAIYSLSDLGRTAEALKLAQKQLSAHPDKPKELVKAYVYVERRHAIELARAGKYDQALAILKQLRAKYPSDVTETMDYIAVSGWAGHDKDATTTYEKIQKSAMPDYVLEAVAHSYRNQHQPKQALDVYRRGLKQDPRNEVFAAGEVRCLDDMGQYGEGVSRAKAFTAEYGGHLEVLLAGGEAANFDDEAVEALNFYVRADDISPRNNEAMRGLIHAEDRAGAPDLAMKNATKHPGLMKADELNAIVGDQDSQLVRWGPLEPENEATRYAATDEAISTLNQHINEWSAKNDPSVYPNILRARFDRMIALRDRARWQDVINEYNDLVGQGVEIPAFALEPVGEAYLALRQPEVARDIFLKVLQSEPNDFESRRLLAYAYLECEQYDEAYATIDKLREDEPQWVYLKGEPERQPNANRAMVELDSGALRSYADELDAADAKITPVVEAAPYDARNRAAAGNIDLMRGWPRKALEQFEIGKSIQDGHDVANETGIAMANLELQNFEEAENGVNSLMQRFPENPDVQRAKRELDVHNMAELDAHAGYQFAPSEGDVNNPNGQGFDVGAELYSSPIDFNWRLFAGEDFFHEHEPEQEGILDYSRTNAGAEYRNGDVTTSGGVSYNRFDSGERVGAFGKGEYTFNDMWSAGIAAELFSADTPLRALNAGVTADNYEVNGKWRGSESESVTFSANAMPFSDGNFRTGQDAEYIRRLYTDDQYQLDFEGNAASQQNSKNEARSYYNPSLDFTALAGLRGTQNLYRHYETLWDHSLLAMAGVYAQQNYNASPAWTIRYEHRLHYDDTLNAGVGVNYTHQDYDGSAEDAVSLTMDVVERF
jgi:biofilm PGA synthesis protein PgaA